MKKTTIDANLLPNIWLTWATTKATFYMNCATGVKQTSSPDIMFGYKSNFENILLNSGSKPRYGYAKYHEDIHMLELAEVTIDTTRKEEIKQWRYAGPKYFLGKDKRVFDENGDEVQCSFRLSQYHSSYDFKGYLGMFYRIGHNKIVKEFKKFLGSDTYTVGSGRVVEVQYTWNIQEWYKTKQKVRGEGKQQKLTNKLTEMPVSDVSNFSTKHPALQIIDSYGYIRTVNGIIYFERLSDGWSVLRIFNRVGAANSDLQEIERMYLHDDGTNRIVSPSKDGWFPSRQNNGWREYRLVNKDEAMQKCNRLKYILPLLDDENPNRIKGSIMTILRFPEIEQMINLGYGRAAKSIIHSNTPKAEMKEMFGAYYNEKESTILRKAGLTKYQFDKLMSMYTESNCYYSKVAATIKEMRKFFGDSLKHLDNANFDKYLHAIYNMIGGWRYEIYPQIEQLNIDRSKFIKNVIRLGEKNQNVYNVVRDTLDRYCSLNAGTRPEINWYFDSYSDVVRAHDAIDELKRAQDAERRAMWNMADTERRKKEEEKRIKLDKERKAYEYEDDAYVIRLPNDSNEIVREGSLQKICIGGYTSRHALGQTNLFFMRRKSDPTIPFYAIEMDNGKNIVQIHGFGNSWLGNHPEAIPTVVRWLRKNGIKCSEKILTCTAKGYSATNNYVKMPVVD